MARGFDGNVEVEELQEIDPAEPVPYSVIRRQLVILAFFPLAEAIAWTSIFPYIYFMVQSFSDSESGEKNAAIYASFMVSCFTFGEFIMAPQWARISDRIGRKPTLLIGSMGAVISAITFGVSSSLPMAMVARTLGGMLNPNLGVIPTYIGEMVSKEQQGTTKPPLPAIVGPVIGGYLAEPVKNYPSVFHEGTVWDRFPYLLPNLVVVVLLLASCTLGLFWLKEVHPKFRDRFDIGQRLVNAVKNFRHKGGWNATEDGYTPIRDEEGNPEISEIPAARIDEIGETKPSAFTKQVILQIISNAILGFLTIAALAMIPILLATPTQSTDPESPQGLFRNAGGFGLDTTGISNILLFQAIASILSQFLAVPAIISRKGALSSYRIGLFVLLCTYCIMPFTAVLPSWVGIAAILVVLSIYAQAVGLVLTCSAILITNTVPSLENLAIVNGTAASFGCLARTFGPAISGPLFRLGLQIGYIGLPFWLLGVVTSLGLIVSMYLRDHH
ncbi:hypothetical protein B7463_g3940, partial [Scytalidium lignicola]